MSMFYCRCTEVPADELLEYHGPVDLRPYPIYNQPQEVKGMYTISKEFHVCASHRLEDPCSRLHGHNYVITVELTSSKLNEDGFVMDYGELTKTFGHWLNGVMDHQHLNDRVTFNPTAENLAKWLYDVAADMGLPVSRVGVSETPKTQAWYTPWEEVLTC